MTSKEFTWRGALSSIALIALMATDAGFAYQDKPEEPAKPAEEEAKKPAATAEDKSDAKGDDKADEKAKKKKKKKDKTIEDIVKDFDTMDGLFKLYRDPKKGALHMEISADQLDKEYIYTSQISDGIVFAGHFRGQYRQQRVFTIRKYFDRIEFVELNPRFYFDPEKEISRASTANMSESVMAVAKIKAKGAVEEGEQGEENTDPERYLIGADGLFLSTVFDNIKPVSRPGPGAAFQFKLGKMSRSKSKIKSINNYPENTAVVVDYVFENPNPLNPGGAEVTDARNVTVSAQHTLIAMPDNDYQPRFDDARVGYFLDYVTDLSSQDITPYRDMINRWHLVKKDPTAAVSDPVEPIVWWIENTTPKEIRPLIKKAGESWNIAFEAAGFSNALVIKEQPDDADWDGGDIRYNVLRWTSSPTPPFGGYGPSHTNPRTGQIISADVMLEYGWLGNFMQQGRVFDTAALGHSHERLELVMGELQKHEHHCSLGSAMHLNNLLGQVLNSAFNDGGGYDPRLVEESLYYLILHELGHTLGLNHNMKATQARSYETAHDISAQTEGLVGSVMDYPSINFAPEGQEQAYYYTTKPGPYDIWAIQFGYAPEMDDPDVRAAHLARSNEKGLAFGNDADDMRAPGKAIDPRVNVFDFSDDAVKYGRDRLQMDKKALTRIKDKLVDEGDSYEELRQAYLIITGDMFRQGSVISRYIGGVYINRSVAGQPGAETPYVPVPEAKQREAMQVLADYYFAPDAFAADSELLSHLAIQRRGFAHFAANEDPSVHSRVLVLQSIVIDHILHPNTLGRITDTGLYGNTYSVTEMLGDLTDAVFAADSRAAVNTMRQGLQVMYVRRLAGLLESGAIDYVAQSNVLANLRSIRRNMARWRGNAETRAHREHIAFLIDKALDIDES